MERKLGILNDMRFFVTPKRIPLSAADHRFEFNRIKGKYYSNRLNLEPRPLVFLERERFGGRGSGEEGTG
jgi:hypothetical protein